MERSPERWTANNTTLTEEDFLSFIAYGIRTIETADRFDKRKQDLLIRHIVGAMHRTIYGTRISRWVKRVRGEDKPVSEEKRELLQSQINGISNVVTDNVLAMIRSALTLSGEASSIDSEGFHLIAGLPVFVIKTSLERVVDFREGKIAILPANGDSLDYLYWIIRSHINQFSRIQYDINNGQPTVERSGLSFLSRDGKDTRRIGEFVDQCIVSYTALKSVDSAIRHDHLDNTDQMADRMKYFDRAWDQEMHYAGTTLSDVLKHFRATYPDDFVRFFSPLLRYKEDQQEYLFDHDELIRTVYGCLFSRVVWLHEVDQTALAENYTTGKLKHFNHTLLRLDAQYFGHDQLLSGRIIDNTSMAMGKLQSAMRPIERIFQRIAIRRNRGYQSAIDRDFHADMISHITGYEHYLLSSISNKAFLALVQQQESQNNTMDHYLFGPLLADCVKRVMTYLQVGDEVLGIFNNTEFAKKSFDAHITEMERISHPDSPKNWQDMLSAAVYKTTLAIDDRIVDFKQSGRSYKEIIRKLQDALTILALSRDGIASLHRYVISASYPYMTTVDARTFATIEYFVEQAFRSAVGEIASKTEHLNLNSNGDDLYNVREFVIRIICQRGLQSSILSTNASNLIKFAVDYFNQIVNHPTGIYSAEAFQYAHSFIKSGQDFVYNRHLTSSDLILILKEIQCSAELLKKARTNYGR